MYGRSLFCEIRWVLFATFLIDVRGHANYISVVLSSRSFAAQTVTLMRRQSKLVHNWKRSSTDLEAGSKGLRRPEKAGAENRTALHQTCDTTTASRWPLMLASKSCHHIEDK